MSRTRFLTLTFRDGGCHANYLSRDWFVGPSTVCHMSKTAKQFLNPLISRIHQCSHLRWNNNSLLKKNPHLQTPRCSRSLGSKVKSNKLVTFTKEESSASRYLVQRRWPSEGFVWLHFFKYRKNIWCICLLKKWISYFLSFFNQKGNDIYIYIYSPLNMYIYISIYICKFVLSV